MSRALQQPPTRRSAFVLISVLVLLVVTTALATSWTTDALRGRRQVGLELMHRQAERLSDAAIARAVARLEADPEYTGEVWQLSEQDLGQAYNAEIAIRFVSSNEAGLQQIITQTKLPAGSDPRIRHTATQLIPNLSDSSPRAGAPAP